MLGYARRMERVPSRPFWGHTKKTAPQPKPPTTATEGVPSLVLHIDADRGLTLSSQFTRKVATADRTDIRLETATATEFASHVLAEFMWGTLDPNDGAWLPVGGVPSCSPPKGDDSLIPYGEHLRAQHMAEPLQNPQVCENVRKALQSFGRPSLKKLQSHGSGQRRRVRPETEQASGLEEATPGEATSHERLVELHAQLLKRMMLPLTLRLALGCEKGNPAQAFDVDGNSKATNAKRHLGALHTTGDERVLADSASLGKVGRKAMEPSSAPLTEQMGETKDTGTRTYVERLRSGYWHIAPSIFHTLFTLLKRKTTLKVVLYSRDYLGGPHITRLIEEFNDLCEGKHPAFNGQNRTKQKAASVCIKTQVFLDGSKKTKDMRVSPSQVGSVTLCARKSSVYSSSPPSANEHSTIGESSEETSVPPCISSSAAISYTPLRESFSPRANTDDGSRSCDEEIDCCRGPQRCHRASFAAQPCPSPEFVWHAEFAAANRTYKDVHELYTGLMYEILKEHNVACLCFGSPVPAPASSDLYHPEESTAFSRTGCLGAECAALRLRAFESESWAHAAALPVIESKPDAPLRDSPSPSRKMNNQTRESRPPTAQKNHASKSRPLSAVADRRIPGDSPSVEMSCQLKEGIARSDIAQVPPRHFYSTSCAPSPSSTVGLYPVSFSLDAPLVPLPVLVDPVDYSIYHICISAPALLSVQQGLCYMPSFTVVEVVHGSTIFGAVHPFLFSVDSVVNADASSLPPAATAENRSTALSQLHMPAADMVSAPETGEVGRVHHHRGLKGELLHSSLVRAADAQTSPVSPTFRGAYLIVSAAYCVIITEPCSLLCNPEHLLRLTEQCIECRIRQLKEGKTEKDTVVLAVENGQQTPTPVGAAVTAHGAMQETAQVFTGVKDTGPLSAAEKNSAMPIEYEAIASQPQTSNLLEAATKRTTLECLDPYAHLTAPEIKLLHPRDYLKATIVPVLLPALESILTDRPDDPLAWMAFYLLRHAEGYERTAP